MLGMHVKKNLSCCEAEHEAPRKTASQRVFETARELFYRRGVRAVGIDEIVAEAGVTKPSLYRAFASKDALVAACLEESAKEGRMELDAVMAKTPDDPREQLRGIMRHYGEKMTRPDFRGCPMSNTAVEFPEPGHLGRTVLEECKAGMHTRLAEVTRRMPIDDPDALADGLMLIIEGAMASHHIFGSQGPSSSLMITADALIDSYLKAKTA
jgi:AcrR family transcriptional regulator